MVVFGGLCVVWPCALDIYLFKDTFCRDAVGFQLHVESGAASSHMFFGLELVAPMTFFGGTPGLPRDDVRHCSAHAFFDVSFGPEAGAGAFFSLLSSWTRFTFAVWTMSAVTNVDLF